MNVYIKHRFLLLLPVLLGITFFTFVLMQLPADDTVDMMYKASGAVSETVKAAARAELGLDRPLLVRYLDWLLAVCSGDMGRSYISGTPVTALFVAKLQPTLYLTALLYAAFPKQLFFAGSSCVLLAVRSLLYSPCR